MSGRSTSRMRQPGKSGLANSRYSEADPKVTAFRGPTSGAPAVLRPGGKPPPRRTRCDPSRSSRRARGGGKREAEYRSPRGVSRGPEPALVRLDDPARDREPHAHARFLRGEERLEHALHILEPAALIADFDQHTARAVA